MKLYDRWLQVASHHANSFALIDAASDQRWTFAQLQTFADDAPPSNDVFREAHGRGLEFVIDTLAAWRDGSIVSPCEGQMDAIPSSIIPPSGACHVKRTSGSTGTPRLVWFTESQLAADVDQIVSTMGMRTQWPNLGVISLAHSYGFSNLVLPLLLHGIPLVLATDALPGTVEKALSLCDQVTLPAVPAMWRAWASAGILNDHIALAISAGAPLTLTLEQSIYEQFDLKIHNFYGSSECGGIAYDRTDKPRTDAAFVGTAMDGVSLSIIEERLQVTSPAVGLGYADNATDASLRDGHFLTTDHAELDPHGAVYLRGRQGDSINVAGRKVSPQMIEEAILNLTGVEHAIAFGIRSKNPERVDEVVAVIRLNEGVSLPEVTKSLTLPSWQKPRHWWVCETLAPDARGKISRAQWRERYLNHHHS